MPKRSATNAVWLLRVALVIQCAMQASLYVFDPFHVDSPAYELMVRRLAVDPESASRIDQQISIAALGAACALLCVPLLLMILLQNARGAADRWPWNVWQLPIIVCLVIWNVVLLAGDALASGGGAVGVLTFALGAAPRVAVPLALLILCCRTSGESATSWAPRVTIVVLAVATFAAFASLSWQALKFDGALVDTVMGAARHTIGWSMSEDAAQYLVRAIGIVSGALAVLLLILRWQGAALAIAIIAALWLLVGLAEGGLASIQYIYPEVMLRTASVAVPLAIVLLQLAGGNATNGVEDEDLDEQLVIVGATEGSGV